MSGQKTERGWDDVFDGKPLPSPELEQLRRACMTAAERALLPLDEIEALVETFEDPAVPWTTEDLRGHLRALKMSERRPCDEYAPSQRALARWIRSFCFLSP